MAARQSDQPGDEGGRLCQRQPSAPVHLGKHFNGCTFFAKHPLRNQGHSPVTSFDGVCRGLLAVLDLRCLDSEWLRQVDGENHMQDHTYHRFV